MEDEPQHIRSLELIDQFAKELRKRLAAKGLSVSQFKAPGLDVHGVDRLFDIHINGRTLSTYLLSARDTVFSWRRIQ